MWSGKAKLNDHVTFSVFPEALFWRLHQFQGQLLWKRIWKQQEQIRVINPIDPKSLQLETQTHALQMRIICEFNLRPGAPQRWLRRGFWIDCSR